jgi:hypothetical protein
MVSDCTKILLGDRLIMVDLKTSILENCSASFFRVNFYSVIAYLCLCHCSCALLLSTATTYLLHVTCFIFLHVWVNLLKTHVCICKCTCKNTPRCSFYIFRQQGNFSSFLRLHNLCFIFHKMPFIS